MILDCEVSYADQNRLVDIKNSLFSFISQYS